MTTGARWLNGVSILITGGTGSFGQAFVQRILRDYRAARVVIYSRDELKQSEMQQRFPQDVLRFFIGDVRDRERLTRALKGIDIVIHAAALKQVPAAEYNPIECIKTNVIGAENVINACIDQNVKKVIALSTDKAVNPVNLYGATKLCADKLFVAGNHLSGRDGPRFSVVRYGNVIGSRGSVVPFFRERSKTGKLPITDTRMTRFLLNVDDGTAFVVRCLGMMRGGEIFIPKLSSVKILELAKAVCANCEHEIIGIRPGEKLHELLITRDDARHTLEFKDYYVIQPAIRMWDTTEDISYENEDGRRVAIDFEYTSDTNDRWIDADKLRGAIE